MQLILWVRMNVTERYYLFFVGKGGGGGGVVTKTVKLRGCTINRGVGIGYEK